MAKNSDEMDARRLSDTIALIIVKKPEDFRKVFAKTLTPEGQRKLRADNPSLAGGLPADKMAIFICLDKGAVLDGDAAYDSGSHTLSLCANVAGGTAGLTTHVMIVDKSDKRVVCVLKAGSTRAAQAVNVDDFNPALPQSPARTRPDYVGTSDRLIV